MRLFVAVELPADLVVAASRLVAGLRRRCDRAAPGARLSWAIPERMHLTLRFIGEADAVRLQAIEQALAPPFELLPFEVELAGTGVFPNLRRPRVIWAGLTGGGPALLALQQHVGARLASAGVPPDGRPFQPHLTLARVREAAGLRAPVLLAGLADVSLGRVLVRETVLFESRATTGGQAYVARQRTRLGEGRETTKVRS